MVILSDISAFRAQLVVPEQLQLFDYWKELCGGRSMPCRSEIRPTQIPRILPGISLIDIAEDLGRSRIRLAGTRLREIYDREITSLCIEDLDWGDKRDYWLASYKRTVENGVPTQGVIKGPRHQKEHLVQYWLKLPLSIDATENTKMLLCYDYFMPANERMEEIRFAAGA